MENSDLTRESEPTVENGERVKLQWVGDISLNEQLCSPQYHQDIKDQMAKLAREAGPCDVRVGNFEAPIWGDGSENLFKKTRVCTTEQSAKCILPLGLDIVFLGNNHVYDCREKGFENTAAFLRGNGIRFLGAGTSREEAAQPVILEKRGLTLGFLNYVHQNTNPSIPSGAGVYLNYFEEEHALKEIADLSPKVDAVLLYLHWGADELVRLPSLAQRRFGRRAIEAGARVVVFDHAHCLQPHESWQNGHIIYGLGNFIFGDFPDSKWSEVACRTAMARIEISRVCTEGVSFRYLCRRDHMPAWDERKSRPGSHKRLCNCLSLADSLYSIVHTCENIYQLKIAPCFRFVIKCGGIIPSLFHIRRRHCQKVLRALACSFRCFKR